MPPIISIVGKSESGKTTMVERLTRELKSRGYRVATIKHVPQDTVFDQPEKDSWRHIKAGSEATAISSQDKLVLIKPVTLEPALSEIVRFLSEDYDIVLAEGFKEDNAPKIEVHRKKIGTPLKSVKKLVAIVTDEPLENKTRQFTFDDIKSLTDLLVDGFIEPQRERVSLYVNSMPVTLSLFPRQIISNILMALASSLKGVGEVSSIDISLRRQKKQ